VLHLALPRNFYTQTLGYTGALSSVFFIVTKQLLLFIVTVCIKGCETQWISLTNVHSPGGMRFSPAGEILTVEVCLSHCEKMSGNAVGFGACLAVDVDTSSHQVGCWLHTSSILLSSKYLYDGVTQYNVVRCPQRYKGNEFKKLVSI
jgi:hypothetical protein